jgi:hypothetical protein
VISFVGEGGHFGYGACMSHPNKIYILLEPMRRPKKARGVDGFCVGVLILSINCEKEVN